MAQTTEQAQDETAPASVNEAAEIRLEPSWKRVLHAEFEQPYMRNLRAFLKARLDAGAKIFPRPSEYFNAFAHAPFDRVKVVILGQDPYHGAGQAHGLCFSVQPGVRPPPSLLNIFKELKTDVGFQSVDHGYLMPWADQGMLLLNAVLTVEEGRPAAHQGQGWEEFTDRAIHALNQQREHLVFILWGAYAQKKGKFIDRKKHLVIEGPHPSPLSASRGFFGSRPFSKANEYLAKHGLEPIDWQLPMLKDIAPYTATKH
ncbi:MAG: uracil-DNA glycosylase [Bdellovibrionaceae bacterium]|nr:uracil-DNA glycosylase [Pseudobdellovibrionaceae bacterium]